MTIENKRLVEEIIKTIDSKENEFIEISKYIWNNPELGYKEYKACEILTKKLETEGFDIERKAAGLDTAFVATKKSKKDGPVVAIMSEYDSLGEEIGHACGHNLFSVAAVGSAIALSKIIDEIGGTIRVVGTPAEEGIVPKAGAKSVMVSKGIFDDVDIALICHAEGRTIVERELVAATTLDVVFNGKAAHAGGSPHKGINALTAGVLTMNNINAIRQHFLPRVIANVIITEGGATANTIPAKCALKMSLRADKIEILNGVEDKVRNCVIAAAMVTGCSYEINKNTYTFENLTPNHNLGLAFKEALDILEVPSIQFESANYAWDVGNVANVCPALGSYIKIGDESLVGHSPEFKAASCSDEGFKGMIIGAKAMALTVLDYLTNEELQKKVREEFLNNKSK